MARLKGRRLVIVGAGPAGIAGAIQAARDGLAPLLIGDEPLGGLLPAARRIDNYPGFPGGISGAALAAALARQAARFAVETHPGRVLRVAPDGQGYRVEGTDGLALDARAVVVATGTQPRPWDIPGWTETVAVGRGGRDARALPRRLEGESVLVVGGGEAALDTALSARDGGADVLVAMRGDTPRAVSRLVSEAQRAGVRFAPRTSVAAFTAEEGAVNVRWADGRETPFSRVLVCIGRAPRTDLVQGLGVDVGACTDVNSGRAGLFLAGDLIRGRARYIATAVGDGQRAAIAAACFLETVAI